MVPDQPPPKIPSKLAPPSETPSPTSPRARATTAGAQCSRPGVPELQVGKRLPCSTWRKVLGNDPESR